MYALTNACGVISFADRIPNDMSLLPIARGPKKKLMSAISGVARLAYDNETLLVPGIPETIDPNSGEPDQMAGIKALQRFKRVIEPSLVRQGLEVCGGDR